MIKLGITGKMSSGKSFVASKLKLKLEEQNYQVLYLSVDEIRRRLKTSDTNAIKQDILMSINGSDADFLLLEWALLIEDNMASLIDNNILIVHCSENKIYQRLSNPDLPFDEIKRRLDIQTDWSKNQAELNTYNKVFWLNTDNDVADNDIDEISASLQKFDKSTSDFCLFRIPSNGGRVIWEVTNRCNYQCPYCIFSSSNENKSKELTSEQSLNLISEIKQQGFTHLKITGGEPFLKKDIMDILECSKRLGLKTDISTNASLITDEMAKSLSGLNLDMVHVSLDGHTLDIHEMARGKNTFEPTVKGIKNLTAQSNIYVRIGCLIFKGNEDYLKEVAEFCQKIGADEVIFSLMEAVGRGKNITHLISEKTSSYLMEQINNIHLSNIKINHSFSQKTPNGVNCVCPGGKRFLFINSVGVVSPCTWITERAPEYIYPKTLHEDTLENILHDSEFTDIALLINKLGAKNCPAQIVKDLKDVQYLQDVANCGIESSERFTDNSPSYLFTTENLQDSFITKGASTVLTVGSSGDHLFNAVLQGAKEIDCFDINIFSKYIIELKTTAISRLSYDDFIELFFGNNKVLYTQIRQFLSLPCRYLGDLIFGTQKRRILKEQYISKGQTLYNCNYLNNEEKYNLLREALSGVKVNNIVTDIQLLHNNLNKQYDLIHLSNISDYAHLMFKENYLRQYNERIIKPLLPCLTADGVMVCGYVYDALDKNQSSKRSKINVGMARKQAFAYNPAFLYFEKEIKTAVGEDNFDVLLMIKRSNNEKLT